MKLNQLQIIIIIVLLVGGLLFLFPPAKKRIVKPLVYRALLSYENFPERSAHQKNRWDLFQRLPSDPNDIVLLGDSLIEGGEWSELLPGQQVRNRGVSGQTLQGLLKYMEVINAWSFRKIYVLIGINDVINGAKIADVTKNYESLVKSLIGSHSAKKIHLISLLPVSGSDLSRDKGNITKLNQMIKSLAEKFAVKYIDAYRPLAEGTSLKASYTYDGLHLNGAGYMKLSKTLQAYNDSGN